MTRDEFQKVLEARLKMPQGSLKPSDSRATIESWGSFVDVDLIFLIEKEFGIEAESEILEQETFGELLRLLESRGAFRESEDA